MLNSLFRQILILGCGLLALALLLTVILLSLPLQLCLAVITRLERFMVKAKGM
jgi:hypothetical protein